jgi:hypothetical protein
MEVQTMDERKQASLEAMTDEWRHITESYIAKHNGRKDVFIGVSNSTLDRLFPQENIEEKQAYGRSLLDKLSVIFEIPRKDINLGVRYDIFETLTAGYPAAVHYTYRHGCEDPEYRYYGNPKR